MLSESLNRFKLDSTRFQQAFNIFYAFNNVGPPVQTTEQLVQQSVECMLKQKLKLLKRAFTSFYHFMYL